MRSTRKQTGSTNGWASLANVLFFLAVILGSCLAPDRASAVDWLSGVRLGISSGFDTNPLEELVSEDVERDSFLRIHGEGQISSPRLGFLREPSLAVRGFTERYSQESDERRNQGEARFRTETPLGRKGGVGILEAGVRARDYPDSTSRNFSRSWLRFASRFRLGPKGTFRPELFYWTLDYNRTLEKDQSGVELALSYDWQMRPRLVGTMGFELTDQDYDRPSLKADYNPEGELELEFGPEQTDSSRFLRLNLRYVKRGLFQLQYGLRSQTSNSVGSSFRRHEIRWLISKPLWRRISGQCFGTWETTRYRDDDLDDIFILRAGEEQEAADDSNLVAVQLSRPLRSDLRISTRYSWYKNESLLVGSFYRKQVATFTLTWEAGRLSGF